MSKIISKFICIRHTHLVWFRHNESLTPIEHSCPDQTVIFMLFWLCCCLVLPDGRGQVNQKGVQYYNNLINELISHGSCEN